MSIIALCGNHQVVYCTESDLAWTLESMGHTVVRFQENGVSTETILEQCTHLGVQLLLYVHTHGWRTPGQMGFWELLIELRARGIKTASFHLDRYWGLEIGDQRESRVGQHAFWRTDKIFTADGGNQARFEARGVPHVWLPPAIAARHCYRGTYTPALACDVAFVGQRGYHQEYPFRAQLIAWLEQTYGSRFRRFAGDCPGGVIREQALNNLYASVKIVVGDSCFAGAPYYWSDRVPETLGRGGFLIHPQTPGLGIAGLTTFEPGNLTHLQELIDHFVQDDGARWTHTELAMGDVRMNHTYTNRMQTLLEVMGL